ncbi:MAG: lactonase family protein [Anaerolineae bacterium]|jgi:6-phosphogluconolactonase
MARPDGKTIVYVGTYTQRGSEGIYAYAFDPSSGILSPIGTCGGVENPSFLALAPSRRYLYATDEVSTFAGNPGGGVSAFRINQETGLLTLLNHQPSHGAAPCHLSVDQTEQVVLVANYSTGSIAVLPIEEGGRLGPATDVVQHAGSGTHPTRQQGPHAHSITIDPTNRYAFAADLGIDKLMVYRLDLEHGKLVPHDIPSVEIEAGSGPRHFAFHPGGKYAYLINELGSTVTVFRYDAERVALHTLQTISTLPEGTDVDNTCADVHISPSGRFLYGSNRGHDSIAAFRIDETTGRLSSIGHTSTQGKTPRNFGIDPSGRFLLAANQDSDSIVSFRIDGQSGELSPTGEVTSVPMPVCVLFATFPESAR